MVKWISKSKITLFFSFFMLILLICSTIILYTYTRTSALMRKEAFELFPIHMHVEQLISNKDLSDADIEKAFIDLPKGSQVIFVKNKENGLKNIFYNEIDSMIDKGINKLFIPLLNTMLKQINIDDVVNSFYDEHVTINFRETSDGFYFQVVHAIDTEHFKGDIYVMDNLTANLLDRFKGIIYQTLLIACLAILFTIINYIVINKLLFIPFKKMRKHYASHTKFNMKLFDYEKMALSEVKETIDVVNNTILEMQEGIIETKSFLDEMVHEIKNPAHNIKNEIEFINDSIDDQDIKLNLSSVTKETENIISLLSSIKILYDIYYLGGEPPNIWIEPIINIENIVNEYRAKQQNRIFYFKHHLKKKTKIWMDEGSIELIIRNLLDNAIKYSRDGSSIFIGIREDDNGNKVLIDIVNTDSSIEYNKIGKIFDKYYRTNDAKESTVGAGIGLWLVKNIVEIYEAEVSVQSTHNTTGFILTFEHVKHD